MTLAGAMALGIAENLVGLVVHQQVGKGSPFLFGPNVSALDMRSAVVSYGCPEWSLTQAALADMRDEIYGLPIWAYGGASDAKVMDAQSGAEAMFSIITAMLSRCNLIHDVGFLEYGSTSSLEMVTMANELVAMSRVFVRGIPVNDEKLLDRSRYESWVEAGATDLYQRCNTEAKRILAEHQVDHKTDGVLKAIDQVLQGH